VSFAGVWPTAPGGPYYLKVAASVAEDINPANNVSVSGPYTTTFVDYTVSAVNNLGGTVAGQTLSANFVLENIGTGAGSQPVSWTAYISTSATLSGGDAVVASGTSPALPAMNTLTIPFSSHWPNTAGTWYLIISVSATDDTVPGNDIVVSAQFTTTPAQPDYSVTAVTNTGGSIVPAGAVNFQFQINNISLQNGTQPISWTVWASTINVLDGTAIRVASGTTQQLPAPGSVVISGSGPWPLHYGTYYLIASVTVAEDINPTNNSAATAGATAVGIFAESEPNGDYVNMVNVNTLTGVVLKPGMSVLVTGALSPATDLDDIFGFNTGTANSITFYVSWTGNFIVTLFVFTAPNVYLPGLSSPSTNTISLGWVPDASNVLRWIDLQNGPPTKNIGPYTLVISAN
jgi:hypothetical protein